MTKEEEKFEKWLENLSTNQKLSLVRNLLLDIEKSLVQPNTSNTVVHKKKSKHPLGEPPAAGEDIENFDDLDAVDEHVFRQFLIETGKKPEIEEVTNSKVENIDTLRLRDAAELFERLLKKYGYVRHPPSFASLAKKAMQEDLKRSYENRKRPTWHEWVTKEDENKESESNEELP